MKKVIVIGCPGSGKSTFARQLRDTTKLDERLEKCDTVFLLDFTLDVCISGVKSRIGKKREDMPWIETEFEEEFKQWILGFHENQLPEIYSLLEKYKDKNIVIFKERSEMEQFLAFVTVETEQ